MARNNRVVLVMGSLIVSGMFLGAGRSLAYQNLMNKAKKFGAKDCLFCHVHEDGGVGWNERGLWLIEQKEKRKAEKIDVDWLVDYEPDKENEKAGEPEGKKPGEKEPEARNQ